MVGYVFGVKSMRIGEIGFTQPFRYSLLLWAILVRHLMFDEWPDAWMLVGSAIVVATGLFTFYRERKLGQGPVTAAPSTTGSDPPTSRWGPVLSRAITPRMTRLSLPRSPARSLAAPRARRARDEGVACIGECMVELSLPREPGGAARVGFAGDTANAAIYLKRSAPEVDGRLRHRGRRRRALGAAWSRSSPATVSTQA